MIRSELLSCHLCFVLCFFAEIWLCLYQELPVLLLLLDMHQTRRLHWASAHYTSKGPYLISFSCH